MSNVGPRGPANGLGGKDASRPAESDPRADLHQRLAGTRGNAVPQAGGQRSEWGRGPARGTSLSDALGVTPRASIVLVVMAGVAVAAGIWMAIASLRQPQAEAPAGAVAGTLAVPTIPAAARPAPEEAIADYFMLLRQGMYQVAWDRTTANFQAENYPSGFASYEQAWEGSMETEVVSTKVILRTDNEVNLVAELHDTGSDQRYANAYKLVFNDATGLWQIDSVTRVW